MLHLEMTFYSFFGGIVKTPSHPKSMIATWGPSKKRSGSLEATPNSSQPVSPDNSMLRSSERVMLRPMGAGEIVQG